MLSRPLEENLQRALVFSNGDVTTFVREPLSALLLSVAAAAILLTAIPAVQRRRALLG